MHASENGLHCWERSPVLFCALALDVIPIICLLVQELLSGEHTIPCMSCHALSRTASAREDWLHS